MDTGFHSANSRRIDISHSAGPPITSRLGRDDTPCPRYVGFVGAYGATSVRTELQRALFDAAERALLAPSVLNTQPWRWLVRRSSLDLYADSTRQVPSIDPQRRLLTLSCGGALHHACIALRARGLEPEPNRDREPGDLELLARIRIVGPHQVSGTDRALAGHIPLRHSDRRAIAARSRVSDHGVDLLRRAASEFGIGLHRVSTDQRQSLAMAAEIARSTQLNDESYQRELRAWTSDRHPTEGVPVETLVANIPRPVPLRDFAGGGETALHPGLGDDAFADFLILATPGDGRGDWLRAGEAMSAAWLTATINTIAVSVLSDVIEVPSARAIVTSLLPDPGHPQLVLRVGIAAHPTPPPASPRRRPETVIEIEDKKR
jgi:hypothetical protein